MVDITLSLLWTLFTTVPGLVIVAALGLGLFVSGVAFARRQLRRDPVGFAEKVVRAKSLTADVRARWQRVVDEVKKARG